MSDSTHPGPDIVQNRTEAGPWEIPENVDFATGIWPGLDIDRNWPVANTSAISDNAGCTTASTPDRTLSKIVRTRAPNASAEPAGDVVLRGPLLG